MTREEAWSLVCEHTASESLRRHMQCVEACMRGYAGRLGEDEELWALAGLLHDFDYEAHPDEHPLWGLAVLEKLGIEEAVRRAIAAHYEAKTGVAPESAVERHLVACDEISGFVVAVTYVRPSKDVRDVEVKSVLKKLKEPAFAAGVSREDVLHGCDLIGLPLEEHVGNVLRFLQADAEALGLAGG
jgi:putative nucleotidyltransferase with HDIG domain